MKKKIVSGILIAATVLALTGCGSSDESRYQVMSITMSRQRRNSRRGLAAARTTARMKTQVRIMYLR